jgi:hypothetical protein
MDMSFLDNEFPLSLTIPEGWRWVDPEQGGAPGAQALLLHDASRTDFTANVTVTITYRPDGADIADVARESVDRLRRISEDVSVLRHTEIGTPEAPGVAQVVRLRVDAKDLLQTQVHLALVDLADPLRRMIVQLMLTATPDQLDEVVPGFQALVSSVRPNSQEAA